VFDVSVSFKAMLLELVQHWFLQPEANFHFRGPRLLQIGGPSGRLATVDVIRINTTRARYIH